MLDGEGAASEDGFCSVDDGCCSVDGEGAGSEDAFCSVDEGSSLLDGEGAASEDGFCSVEDGSCLADGEGAASEDGSCLAEVTADDSSTVDLDSADAWGDGDAEPALLPSGPGESQHRATHEAS